MKTRPVCQYVDESGNTCGLRKTASVHVGYDDGTHEYVEERRGGFGQQRKPINPRSEKRERYMREVRRPAVRQAVGDGRQPCEVRIEGVCTGYVESIHETAPRGRFGGLEAAVAAGETKRTCNACNGWLSEHPREAQERGLLRSNTQDGRRARFDPAPKIKSRFKS